MMKKPPTRKIESGVVHTVPPDVKKMLTDDIYVLEKWNDLTSLARNEWLCWIVSVKKPATRKNHIQRTRVELKEGKRRPCCWIGCIHRTDKAISPSIQHILSKRQ